MFDATKSKLYGEIMAGAVKFFSLGPDATEAEVHEAIEGQKPLQEQLEEAKTLAAANAQQELTELKDRVAALEKERDDEKAADTAKDERIAELQTSLTEQKAANEAIESRLDAMKAQHEREIAVLAGKVSKMSAGLKEEQDPGGDLHEAAALSDSAPQGVVAIKSKELREIATRKRPGDSSN